MLTRTFLYLFIGQIALSTCNASGFTDPDEVTSPDEELSSITSPSDGFSDVEDVSSPGSKYYGPLSDEYSSSDSVSMEYIDPPTTDNYQSAQHALAQGIQAWKRWSNKDWAQFALGAALKRQRELSPQEISKAHRILKAIDAPKKKRGKKRGRTISGLLSSMTPTSYVITPPKRRSGKSIKRRRKQLALVLVTSSSTNE